MQIKKLKVKDKWNKDYDRKYNLSGLSDNDLQSFFKELCAKKQLFEL